MIRYLLSQIAHAGSPFRCRCPSGMSGCAELRAELWLRRHLWGMNDA